jgi:predicted RNA polymerase sigma factor
VGLSERGDEHAACAAAGSARRLEESAWPPRLLAQGALTEGALLISRGAWTEARAAYQRAVKLALSASERHGEYRRTGHCLR